MGFRALCCPIWLKILESENRGMGNFVHLHVHSEYSLLDSPVRIDKLVELAAVLDMPALALTDHNSLAGAIQFYQAARTAGVKPVIGCELSVGSVSGSGNGSYHLTLLARDLNGYHSLCRLITAFWLEGGSYLEPAVGLEKLRADRQGVIALSGCRRGELAYLIRQGRYREAAKAASIFRDIWGSENFYLELQDNFELGQKAVNRRLKEIGEELGLPLVATNNVHYLFPEDQWPRRLLNRLEAMSTGPDAFRSPQTSGEYYFKTAGRMARTFPEYWAAIDNTIEVADRCHLDLEIGKPVLSVYPLPPNLTEAGELRRLCLEGLKRLYPAGNEDRARERMEKELAVIEEMGYQGYFLLVWDMVKFAKESGIPVGPGCGSAAGSLVSYLLGITEIDPLEHSLLFERFLNIERRTLPDIDVDFCERGREKVLQYLEHRFGRGKVARVCSFSTLKGRSALREIGRAEGLPAGEIDIICKALPYFTSPAKIGEALRQNPELAGIAIEKEPYQSLIRGAGQIGGLVRHLSLHPSAIIISDKPLKRRVPLQLARSGELMSQYDMYSVEKIGLLKIDLLGRRSLTLCADTREMVRERRSFEIRSIPLNDGATMNTLRRGKTLGIFQLESSGIRGLLKRMPLKKSYDLATVISLYRPGPWDSGMVDNYIRRLEGKELVSYPHSILEPILEETLGVMLYQEQVIQVAKDLAGFSLGEADVLRWSISKRDRRLMEEIKKKFMSGALDRGISLEAVKEVFRLIMCFAGYGLNKAHALGYGLISYRAAYLKTHYTAEFLASILNEGMAYFPMSEYIEEARRWNIPILSFDINWSRGKFRVEEKGLRPGLGYVKDVGKASLEKYDRRRKEVSNFRNLTHFYRCCRKDFNRQAIENMVKVGAFDYTGFNRRQLLFQLRQLLRSSDKPLSGGWLFEEREETVPVLPPFSLEERLCLEKKLSGLFISASPLAPFRKKLLEKGYIYSSDLYNMREREEARLAGLVVARKTEKTKRGERMLFALLEDEKEMFEVIFFPSLYPEAFTKVKKDRVLAIKGYLSWEGKEPKLIARKLAEIGAY